MRTGEILYTSHIPDWSMIPVLPIDNQLWSEPVDIVAQAQICYNEKSLLLRLSAKEEHIRAAVTEPWGMPCEDSCLEFFFCPDPNDQKYFNIEFNPNGCMYLGIGTSKFDLIRLIPQPEVFTPRAIRNAYGWEITYEIPFSFIQKFFPSFAPQKGDTIRANFYKCGDLTEQAHYFTWSPIPEQFRGFHQPAYFGVLEFT